MASTSAESVPAVPIKARKQALVERLLAAKEASGKSFTQIANEIGLTNIYTAQIFHNQQQLKAGTAAALKQAVPALTDEDLEQMQRAPARRYDPELIQDPLVYRLTEAVMHAGDAIRGIVNEEFGDGIMSAIGFYCSVDKVVGKEGEPRVVITFNGKFLPFVEQRQQDNVVQRQQ